MSAPDATRRLRGPAREIDRRLRYLDRRITDAMQRGDNPAPERQEERALLFALASLDRERWRESKHEPPPTDPSARVIAFLRGGTLAVLHPDEGRFTCRCGCKRDVAAEEIQRWC